MSRVGEKGCEGVGWCEMGTNKRSSMDEPRLALPLFLTPVYLTLVSLFSFLFEI